MMRRKYGLPPSPKTELLFLKLNVVTNPGLQIYTLQLYSDITKVKVPHFIAALLLCNWFKLIGMVMPCRNPI
jgi:hypothetical protein